MAKIQEFLEKLKERYGRIDRGFPILIEIENGVVRINHDVPNPNEAGDSNYVNNMAVNFKLKAKSGGDWYTNVSKIHSKYFSSREEFDECIVKSKHRHVFYLVKDRINLESVSIVDVFKAMNVDISLNMDFIMNNGNENLRENIEQRLSYSNRKAELKIIEKELLYKALLQIFGAASDKENDDYGTEEVLVFDYRLLFQDGNSSNITARRGEYYLHFRYVTS